MVCGNLNGLVSKATDAFDHMQDGCGFGSSNVDGTKTLDFRTV